MHSPRTVAAALELAASGASATEVARRLAVPRSTVRGWLAGAVPHAAAIDKRTGCRLATGQRTFRQRTSTGSVSTSATAVSRLITAACTSSGSRSASAIPRSWARLSPRSMTSEVASSEVGFTRNTASRSIRTGSIAHACCPSMAPGCWTETSEGIYVFRKADVAMLDRFIGPKR